MTGRTKTALWLMIGPTALLIATFLAYAVVNLMFASAVTTATNETTLFAEQSPIQSIINVLLFLVGAIGSLTWLPGLITGIVLLATPKK